MIQFGCGIISEIIPLIFIYSPDLVNFDRSFPFQCSCIKSEMNIFCCLCPVNTIFSTKSSSQYTSISVLIQCAGLYIPAQSLNHSKKSAALGRLGICRRLSVSDWTSPTPLLLPGVPFTEGVLLLGVPLGVRLMGVLLPGSLWEGEGV